MYMLFARLLTVALLAAIFLVCASTRAADSATCTGLILDENAVPVPAAQLKLTDSASQIHRAESDGAGRFTLKNLPAGDYKLEVRKEGFFLIASRALTLQPGPNQLT